MFWGVKSGVSSVGDCVHIGGDCDDDGGGGGDGCCDV